VKPIEASMFMSEGAVNQKLASLSSAAQSAFSRSSA
jgi:hypothetical protein